MKNPNCFNCKFSLLPARLVFLRRGAEKPTREPAAPGEKGKAERKQASREVVGPLLAKGKGAKEKARKRRRRIEKAVRKMPDEVVVPVEKSGIDPQLARDKATTRVLGKIVNEIAKALHLPTGRVYIMKGLRVQISIRPVKGKKDAFEAYAELNKKDKERLVKKFLKLNRL